MAIGAGSERALLKGLKNRARKQAEFGKMHEDFPLITRVVPQYEILYVNL